MKTITFSSYKDGVGRTLALANFARYLAAKGHKVFVMDLDIEAPGLHYKLPPTEERDQTNNLGFISYINYWYSTGRPPANLEKFIYEYKNKQSGTISVMPAGNSKKDSYWRELRNLNWHSILFDEGNEGLAALLNLKYQIRDYSTKPEYLLIDATTGITEVGGVETTLLSDSVVLLFNNNEENLDGIMQMAKVLSQVPPLDRQEPINIFPVPVRLPAIDPEYDENVNDKINENFRNFLGDSINNIHLHPSQILHTDREIEVVESLLIGDYQANESSVLYRDYQILFERLLGKQTFPKDALLEATEVSYEERMRRVISILESLKLELSTTDTIAPIPRNLLKKIKIGAEIGKPESDYSDKRRHLWSLKEVTEWQFSLPDKLKGGLKEFWVLLPRFLAYDNPAFQEITGNNLMEGAKYIYFLRNSEDVTRLKTVAVEIVNYLKRDRKETKETVIEETVAKNLRYVFVTDKLFRAYLRHLNYWIANPESKLPDNDSCPQGFEVVTERGKPIGAVPLKAIECQEIFNLVTYSLGDGTALEGFSAID